MGCTDPAAPSHVPKVSVEKANNDQTDHSRFDTLCQPRTRRRGGFTDDLPLDAAHHSDEASLFDRLHHV